MGAPHVVLVPGMGAPGYLGPLVEALVARGARCSLLDIPGFTRRGPLACEPTVAGIGARVTEHLLELPDEPVLLVGHSTGAQAALDAAARLQGRRSLAALVLAGAAVAPTQRGLLRVALTAPAAFRRDSPRELVVLLDYVRAGGDAVRLLRSAIAHRPEVAVAAVTAPVTVTAGRSDAFAPSWWQRVLLAGAVRSARAVQVDLPGSHNNPFTQPAALADVILSAPSGAARTS